MKKITETVKNEWPLFLGWLVMATAYSVLTLFRHWHFQSNVDLSIFDQAIWHYSRFEKPVDTIRGMTNLLGDHFHPVLALLAPLDWFFSGAEGLLVAQSIFITLSLLPLFFFAKRRIGRLPAYFIAFSFSVVGGIQAAVEFDFHEVSFAVAFAAFAIYFMDRQKWNWFYLSIFLLGMTKEDLWLLAAFFGIFLAFRGEVKKGVAIAVAGFLLFGFEVKVLIPWIAASKDGYIYWRYSQLGPTPWAAMGTCFLHPIRVLCLVFSNREKILGFAAVFAPFLFFPFRSPLIFLSVPLIGEKFLSDDEKLWRADFQHYSAVLSVVLAFAAADGIFRWFQRLEPPDARKKRILFWSAVILCANLAGLPFYRVSKLSRLLEKGFFSTNEIEKAGARALAVIPPGASVLAQSCVAPHLTHRSSIYYIGLGMEKEPKFEDYVIACESLDHWPFSSFGQIENILAGMEKNGYRRVFSDQGWVVLEKIKP